MTDDFWSGFGCAMIVATATIRLLSLRYKLVPKNGQIENLELAESYRRFKADIAPQNKDSKETAKTGVKRPFK